MNGTAKKCGRRQRGIAIIEFMIVAPILLLMMFMVAELGRTLFEYNALSKAVRDGARYYSAHVFVDAAAVDKTQKLVTYGKTVVTGSDKPLLPGSLDSFSASLDSTHNWVTVSAQYTIPLPFLNGILGLFGSSLPGIPVDATTTMRAI